MPKIYPYQPEQHSAFLQLWRDRFSRVVHAEGELSRQVQGLITQVREQGDQALCALTQKYDQWSCNVENLQFSPQEIAAAHDNISPELKNALILARDRIEAFHRRQELPIFSVTDDQDVSLAMQWRPLSQVGLYVPGGQASYPSSVLMNAIPARLAGVKEIILCVPTPANRYHEAVLVAADIVGVDKIFRVGGAQAIAAMALGTETIPRVDKIVGPGNAYVAEAKRQMSGLVGIDMVAGPSEVLIVAEKGSEAQGIVQGTAQGTAQGIVQWIAMDLLAQAEHDPAAQAICICDDQEFAQEICQAVEGFLVDLPRREIAQASWRAYGGVFVVKDIAEAVPLINHIAPEHLQLIGTRAEKLVGEVQHAGCIFVGALTPEAIGDYTAGSNHVLPTYGSARFSSGLDVYAFLKRMSIVSCTSTALQNIGPAAVTLAEAESLSAHARSVQMRLDAVGDKQSRK